MALLNFPPTPNNGDIYPSNPLPGQSQYEWSSADNTWRLLGPATGVIPGCYGSGLFIPTICFDAQGRATSVTVSPFVAVTYVDTGVGLLGGPITTTGTIDLDTAYTDTLYLSLAGGTMVGDITFSGTQTFPNTISSITAGVGLNGGTITSTGTIDLADTTVGAGSYTYASFTVDAQGRLTAASNGVAPVTAVTGTSPISVTAGTTPDVSVADASTGGKGVVQLQDSVSSLSTTTAATPNSVRIAYDLAAAALPLAGGALTGAVTFDPAQTFPGTATVVTAPAASTDPGVTGQVAVSAGFFYWYDGAQWLRVAGSVF